MLHGPNLPLWAVADRKTFSEWQPADNYLAGRLLLADHVLGISFGLQVGPVQRGDLAGIELKVARCDAA